MASAPVLHRIFGLRAGEAATVWLFFCHNFLLGIGTILVYVSANVILLENHPETSLPLAYLVSAGAMMAIGRLYTYFEHHLMLQRLAVRVLVAVSVLTFVMALLVATGHSVAAAIAIMAGYRIIYLLTNLEFWGISAVVFDVRQSKRLFSVISSGDMPAKALGALLSIIIHNHTELYLLLLGAFGAYMAALVVLQFTIRSHQIDTSPAPVRLIRRRQPSFIKQLFGGSELVFTMCLSLMAVAAVVTSVEYFFFVNVKHKFHAQADLMTAIGSILALTYLLAMLFKLIFSRQTFEHLGIRRSLSLLPISGLAALVIFGGLHALGVNETALLIYFCGLYLLLEVLRRAVYDPIFLVLFQPLSPPDRLKGHSLVKGFYEPLGMGLAGLLLLIFNNLPEAIPLVAFGWMALFMGVALFYGGRSANAYLVTLKETLERRFSATTDLVLPATAVPIVAETLRSDQSEDVLNGIDWLQAQNPAALLEQADFLFNHPDGQIRYRMLNILKGGTGPTRLESLALTDPSAAIRERAAFWLARRANYPEIAPLLLRSDWALQAGLIDGWLSAQPGNPQAQQRLRELVAAGEPNYQIAVLKISHHLPVDERVQFIKSNLTDADPGVRLAAISAAGRVADPALTPMLVDLLPNSDGWRRAAASLVKLGSAAVPYLRASLDGEVSESFFRRVTGICGQIATPESRALLVELVQLPNMFMRAIALRDLRHFPPERDDLPLFQSLLADEWRLAQRLTYGQETETDPVLLRCIDYEWRVVQQRMFGWLGQLYEPGSVADAQRGMHHAARDREANALEMLDNLMPHTVYRGVQAVVGNLSVVEMHRAIERLVGRLDGAEPFSDYIIWRADLVFSPWTVAMALRHWSPDTPHTGSLFPLLESDNPLIQECALDALNSLPIGRWDHFHSQLAASSYQIPVPMSHTTTNSISATSRVLALKRTALFADTPENVLASIVPIMKEATYTEGQEIFSKGAPGDCMFIVYEGEVGIFDGPTLLASVEKGGFFGELALLDTETRSASAVALENVVVFRIDQTDFYDLTEERAEVLQNIIRVLCQRLRKQNELLRAV